MREVTTVRRRPIVPILSVIFLAFAVFGWGLKYKMSLYNPPGSSAVTTRAKLLSQKERPSFSRDLESFRTAPPQPQRSIVIPLLLVVVWDCCLNSVASHRTGTKNSAEDSQLQRFSTSSFFSFRPPPAPYPSN
jgi:hypothetical protein